MNIGIDLGTTYSLISYVGSGGKVSYIPDITLKQNLFTPSVVNFFQESAFVGRMAENVNEHHPEVPTIRFFKRNFGEGKPLFFTPEGLSWYPESIGALVLKKLRYDAEGYFSDLVGGSVITVPAHFSDPQRKAILNAAYLADLPVHGLIEEPVAAALHYGITKNTRDKLILVYDLGGGTFDLTLLSMDEKGVYVHAKDGTTELGGKDFDEKIGEIILKQYYHFYGQEELPDARFLLNLRKISEEIKIELCMPQVKKAKKMCLLGDKPLEVMVTYKEFEEAILPYINTTLEIIERCLKDAGVSMADVDSVILVGGSSMIPLVKEKVQTLFQQHPVNILFHDPMKAVAGGAAMHVCQLDGKAMDYNIPPELKGVSGYHIGVKSLDAFSGKIKIDTVIKKNLPLPLSVTKTYYTNHAAQEMMLLEFFQFLDKSSPPISMGRLKIDLEAALIQNYPVEVSIEYSLNGTVHVNAFDPQSGRELRQSFGSDHSESNYLVTQKAMISNTKINNIF